MPGHLANVLGRGLVVVTTSEDRGATTVASCGSIFAVQSSQSMDRMK